MRTLRPEVLAREAFLPFGQYANLINPAADKLGAAPCEFFRDMVQLDLGGASSASFSTCRVEPREPVIDVIEYHTACSEGLLPLDQDILLHVAPASAADGPPPLDAFRVFRIPRGTVVMLRPGTWHYAPFTATAAAANVLIVLPQRTYANDCRVIRLAPADQIRIQI